MTAGPPEQKPLRLPVLRFSMRSLMRLVTGFAVVCGLAVILPIYISQIVLGAIWIAAIGWLVTGVVFARGDQRAFCLGAGIVFTSMWTGVEARFLEGITRLFGALLGGVSIGSHVALWFDFLVLFIAAGANGWLCVRARRYFERNSCK